MCEVSGAFWGLRLVASVGSRSVSRAVGSSAVHASRRVHPRSGECKQNYKKKAVLHVPRAYLCVCVCVFFKGIFNPW